jgi:Na+-transporting NADH:ubiquinone oxidoreductase subunit A
MAFRVEMKTVLIRRGLDIPMEGAPEQVIGPAPPVELVGLVGDDYIGLKPTMLVQEGERVKLGQPLFIDKRNEAAVFTSPGAGVVAAINRGAKRRFESLVIRLAGETQVEFAPGPGDGRSEAPETLRRLLQQSGLWCGLRTRPFGRIPAAAAAPSSLFVTAMDTNPLAGDPLVAINEQPELFRHGLALLRRCLSVPVHLCSRPDAVLPGSDMEGVESWGFAGPHPAGLPSTHIHFVDPAHSRKEVWHICAQDVIAIGHLFATGKFPVERIIALGGTGFTRPRLVRTQLGASLAELCRSEPATDGNGNRLISGSPLDGRTFEERTGYLGRYHRQVASVAEGSGRSLFGWLTPGFDRFSVTGLFASTLKRSSRFSFLTAAWGGRRAIYPLGTYEKVMPLDIVITTLLKSLAVGDTQISVDLGCLELIEEDLALASFVCPGKNEFGPMLRSVLTAIEEEG